MPRVVSQEKNISQSKELESRMTDNKTQSVSRAADGFSSRPRDISFTTNFFKFKMGGKETAIVYKYDVKFTPGIEARHQKQKLRVFGKMRNEVKEKYKFIVYEGNEVMYSAVNIPEESAYKADIKGQQYTMVIKFVQIIGKHDKDFQSFYGVFMNSLFRRLELKQIGRKHFDPSRTIVLKESKINIMPGFSSSIGIHEDWPLINIDSSHRILRDETAYDLIMSLKNERDSKFKIKSAIEQWVVLTQYNKNSTYSIRDIMFDMTPKSTFPFFDREKKEKYDISYSDYYSKMYQITIKDLNQPLLEHFDKKQKRKVYLIPELCKLTGMSDEHRKNFRLMKEMATVTHKSAEKRMEDINGLFKIIKESERCQALMKEWDVSIDNKPLEVRGYKLNAGNFWLGKKRGQNNRIEFKAEDNPKVDTDIQTKMYEDKKLSKWMIIGLKKETKTINLFADTFEKCWKNYEFEVNPPKMVFSGNDKELYEEIERIPNPETVNMIVVVVSGPKLNNQTYNKIKELTFNKWQIPTQFINPQTFAKGKGIQSIVNRILMQINSKIGGAPWGISDLPFSDKPMMVMGLSLWKKNQKSENGILVCTSTVNPRLNKYITIWKEVKNSDATSQIAEWVTESIKSFKAINNADPSKLIVYRDGLSESQQTLALNFEIPAIKKALEEYKETQFAYIIANKKVSWRYFPSNRGRLDTAGPGMVVEDTITSKGEYQNFFMVSQVSRQGAASPSHYYILYADESLAKSKENLIKLSYKLWYLYFHINAGIKIPAPIQYAERCGALLGDKVNSGKTCDFILPGDRFIKNSSLFYI